MNFEEKLSARIGMSDIREMLYVTQGDENKKQELYDLLFVQEDKVAYQAAWVLSHFSSSENRWLYSKQDELIDEVLICKHIGKRRLILALLYRQPFTSPLRIDFLDFCLERMLSKQEPPGVQSLCMKIAYELCFPIPELKRELKTTLEMMEGELTPAIYASKKNILNAMARERRLQVLQ